MTAQCPLWVRSGHKAVLSDVRFTPKSGHWDSAVECPLCAKSGHFALRQGPALFDHLVRTGTHRWRHGEAKRFSGLEIDH
jgi:hypothetical protein